MARTDTELLIASRAEVAGDLLAETFAVVFERRRRFKDVGRPGAAWLYGIAAKELSHWFRRHAIEQAAARRRSHLQARPAHRRTARRLHGPQSRGRVPRRCYTTAGLEEMARQRLSGTGRAVSFRTGEIPGEPIGPRAQRMREGCAIVYGVGPAADGFGIVVEIDE